jgi:hypothetical protein
LFFHRLHPLLHHHRFAYWKLFKHDLEVNLRASLNLRDESIAQSFLTGCRCTISGYTGTYTFRVRMGRCVSTTGNPSACKSAFSFCGAANEGQVRVMPSDLFISYARKDDVQGFVTALHDKIEADCQTLAGQYIDAFFDIHDIVLFDDWREKILSHLQSARLFLACLSPNYFTSDACRWEWAEWIKHELARGHYGSGIATIYFVEPRSLTTPEKVDAVRWMEDLKRRHGINFAPWFPEGRDALQRADARERLRQVTEHVRLKLDQLDLARDIPGNLDAANPGFVGRLSELAQVHQKVRLGPVGVTTAVQGLGGMGKTALALQYSLAYAREYPGGRWQLRCASQHDLATVLTQINETLQLTWTEPEQRDTRQQAQRVLRECKSKGHTLLILDNVDSPALLSAAQTSTLLQGEWLHTLFTTRLPKGDFPGLPASSEFLTLDRLEPFDALQLIRQHQPDQIFPTPEEERAAAEIIEALGGLTLAIETAAIYLGQHASQIKPSAYLQRHAATFSSIMTTKQNRWKELSATATPKSPPPSARRSKHSLPLHAPFSLSPLSAPPMPSSSHDYAKSLAKITRNY